MATMTIGPARDLSTKWRSPKRSVKPPQIIGGTNVLLPPGLGFYLHPKGLMPDAEHVCECGQVLGSNLPDADEEK